MPRMIMRMARQTFRKAPFRNCQETWCDVLAALFILSPALSAQAVATVTLTRSNAFVAYAFSSIRDVVELRDGRLLIADPAERTLWLATIGHSPPQKIGRQGSGPAEFRDIDR